MGDFERDTAVSAAGEGAFEAQVRPDWWVVAGPNGGYIAAMIVRALEATLRPGRPLRSITLHYMRAPKEGPARIETEVVKDGRSVTFATAKLTQGGRHCASAMAVFADSRGGVEHDEARPSDMTAPEDAAEPAERRPQAPPFARNFRFRPMIGGPPFEGAQSAVTGGWMLPHEPPDQIDAAYAVALTDSWFPAIFSAVEAPLAVPTLDLTVHLRAPLPRPIDWVLGRFTTAKASEGLLDEDGLLWSREGELLAQSRQLALAL